MATTTTPQQHIEAFWNSMKDKSKPTQLQRYEAKQSPDCIKKFIAIGGGPKMGTTLEQYARFHFTCLKGRNKGKCETGYDQVLTLDGKDTLIEQKSSGHWGEDDYKWQHVEEKHKWNMLLLCGIDYTDIKFWAMNRETFAALKQKGKITNQGNKGADSSEGVWFNYSDVKEELVEIRTNKDLITFVLSLPSDPSVANVDESV
jgi:hypothetical protein